MSSWRCRRRSSAPPAASGQQALAARRRVFCSYRDDPSIAATRRLLFSLSLLLPLVCTRARVLVFVCACLKLRAKWQCFWLGRKTRTLGSTFDRRWNRRGEFWPAKPESVRGHRGLDRAFQVFSFSHSFLCFSRYRISYGQAPPPFHRRPTERNVMRPAERN